MTPFGELWIWDDPALRDSLAWYLDVADNRRPAKFLIAATIPFSVDLDADGPKTGHALTFILDHLNRADQSQQLHLERIFLIPSESQTL